MIAAVVTAGGVGSRMGAPGGKQFISLLGEPLLGYTLKAFEASLVEAIVVVVHETDIDRCRVEVVEKLGFSKVVSIVKGGVERQHSVANGLKALPLEAAIVAIHDGARPLVKPELINECIGALPGSDGVVPVVPLKDTLKVVAGDIVVRTMEKSELFLAQTPQVFSAEAITEAHERASREGFLGTDDASLIERYGGGVRVLAGDEENIKVTTPFDLVVAEAVLHRRMGRE